MSTEAAAAPPQIESNTTPQGGTTEHLTPAKAEPPQNAPKPVTIPANVLDIVKQAKGKGPLTKPPEKPAETTPSTEKKDEPPKTDVPKVDDPKQAEAAKPDAEKEKTEKAISNEAQMRKLIGEEKAKAETLQKERDAIRAELESLRKNPVPETTAKELSDLRKQLEEKEKSLSEVTSNLRAASLERDPEFRQKFDAGIQTRMQSMADIAVAAGIPKDEALRGVQSWNQGAFAEWVEKMPPLQQAQFGAALNSVVTLDSERTAALRDADKHWQDTQKRREDEAKAQSEAFQKGFKADADTALAEIFGTDALKDREDLKQAAQSILQQAVDQKMPRKEVLKQIAYNTVMGEVLKTTQADMDAKDVQIAELQKKIDEQDAFIKKNGGATPVPGNGEAGGTQAAKPRMPWDVKVNV